MAIASTELIDAGPVPTTEQISALCSTICMKACNDFGPNLRRITISVGPIVPDDTGTSARIMVEGVITDANGVHLAITRNMVQADMLMVSREVLNSYAS